MHGFVAREGGCGATESTKVTAGFHPSFDGAVVLFDGVVEMFDRPVLAASKQQPLLLERLDGGRVARVLAPVLIMRGVG